MADTSRNEEGEDQFSGIWADALGQYTRVPHLRQITKILFAQPSAPSCLGTGWMMILHRNLRLLSIYSRKSICSRRSFPLSETRDASYSRSFRTS